MMKVRQSAAGMSQALLGGIGNQIMGMVSAGALAALARNTIAYADDIEESAARIGVGTTKLQEWTFAAKQTGAGIELLTRFIEQLTDAATDPKKNKALQKLGINAAGMTPEQLFSAVTQFTKGKSATEIRSSLGDIVSDRQLGRMMNLLQSDLDDLGKSAHDIGAVMDTETLHALATLNDQFSIISQVLYTQFGPAILETSKFLLRTFARVSGFSASEGAKTAGMSGWELVKYFTASKEAKEKMLTSRLATDPNQKSFNQTAEDLRKQKIDSIEAMIARFENWKPQANPTIGPPKEEEAKAKRMAELQLDSLSKAGLFAGGAGKFGGMNLQQQEVKLLADIVRVHQQTYQMIQRILG